MQIRPARVMFQLILISCLVAFAYARNHVWSNERTLWGDTVRKSPGKERAYTNLCSFFSSHGNTAEALVVCTKAIGLNQSPDLTRVAYINRGALYCDLGKYQLALADYQEAIVLSPGSWSIYNNIANVYFKQGLLQEALHSLTQAIRLNPNYELGLLNRGILYARSHQYLQAITDFSRIIALNPRSAAAYGRRGDMYAKTGNLDDALQDLRKGCALGYDPACAILEQAAGRR